ncbi:ethanolamine ammonia-lyase subunit EutC [Bradyrhizobium sp. 147]|uniref:ethanolamine ammonia-lyase subunit EutC n=1 Tax=unclassified Bradyrhizobium TaxID=2631580 RepID=UPI001FF87DDC|nr:MULTISPECIES: ethanolamine ammonia-lyase subunit EutC [unclassified Bradyrhizobium]MCK1544219.1 ethanolamine ammonia-lyase subunit EutC [Bradyrhizobium sp. 179]MCK1624567.1 ethanolamine ammonia-lyase subunit EutC [Bradyrhizobium sp. 160]MCK1679630.1 ethanolamine ammonia-lyase subunit EutC [Bradyrhizobium sp. 147]
MSDPAPPLRPTLDLRTFTPARVALGRSGASLPTRALLDFTLDHARARDAVHAVFEVPRLVTDLRALGLVVTEVRSRAIDRRDYLRRPDLGRQLDAGSAELLVPRASAPYQLALVIGEGLSAAAVHGHAVALLRRLLPLLAADDGVAIGHVVVASGARVALGDEIGAILGAHMVAMLIGERPGLSAPDSLGAYLTFAPKPGRTDAERNCVSSIHRAGLSYEDAAFKIAWLVREGLARKTTGVALKDESADRGPRRIGTALLE